MRGRPAVFIVRHYNDVDHMVPVALRYLELGAGSVGLLLAGEGLERQWLVSEVRRAGGTVETLGSALDVPTGETVMDARARFAAGDRSLIPWLSRQGDDFILCMDWDYTRFGLRAAEETEECGGVSISLPHGDAPYVNLMINTDDIDWDLMSWYAKADAYDHTVVPNHLCAQRYRSLSPDRLHVLGSPRYNRTWLGRLDGLRSHKPISARGDSLKLVLFLRNKRFPVHWEELERAVEIVIGSGPTDLILKHHTRDKDLEELLKAHPKLSDGGITGAYRCVTDEVDSADLLRWADAVIDIGTSIAFEAVLRRMPVLELEYVHANRSTVADYLAQTKLRCRDDLVSALDELRSGDWGGYDEDAWSNFLHSVVEPAGPDVLDDYVGLLRNAR